ncbi:hypothetical protein JZ751_021532 [Albula glossodonta]|uniref:Uncharacterized protein n=1 Tax=Albula glossodonta TaxID=121402 RepID=A0A8T2NJK1_9TELE|nr:hypothetical protein JZ751_021532 [Albula glossodonta]
MSQGCVLSDPHLTCTELSRLSEDSLTVSSWECGHLQLALSLHDKKLLKSSCFLFQSICGALFLARMAWAFSFSSAAVGLRQSPLSTKGSSRGQSCSSATYTWRSMRRSEWVDCVDCDVELPLTRRFGEPFVTGCAS